MRQRECQQLWRRVHGTSVGQRAGCSRGRPCRCTPQTPMPTLSLSMLSMLCPLRPAAAGLRRFHRHLPNSEEGFVLRHLYLWRPQGEPLPCVSSCCSRGCCSPLLCPLLCCYSPAACGRRMSPEPATWHNAQCHPCVPACLPACLQVAIEAGRLSIHQEGQLQKFRGTVHEKTFAGASGGWLGQGRGFPGREKALAHTGCLRAPIICYLDLYACSTLLIVTRWHASPG
jgi:hypothetical protein